MNINSYGLSHSEIPGSKIVCIYPRLIAAYHVLHHLYIPEAFTIRPYVLDLHLLLISSIVYLQIDNIL